MENKNTKSFYSKVYQIVKKIPPGKVATYGQIAKILGTRDARRVGHALHANKDRLVPCHRVVDKNGRLAPNFAFEGSKEQARRLIKEGIALTDEMHVDLSLYLWKKV